MSSPPRARRLALATGLTYNILEWGAEHDQTIVLVHGFLDLAWGWDEVPELLARRYHVIAPDLRGHGDSDWIGPGGYYHFFDYLPDLDEVVARLARGKVVMVGHSMGGSVAAYWAGTRPEQVRALVLLEGIGPPEATTPVPDRASRRAGDRACAGAPPRPRSTASPSRSRAPSATHRSSAPRDR
ncbi:MAG: alpha/beta hydrolase, partial [Kofleriaceae bacterium]